ncbi:methionine adenosyltransferase [Mageeibacillus indolicus]|uniref:S-adenosylmethionine synthase n=2 Tax=Mageeibacillus indolicus TaxID=884684 RepID=D3R1K2_MAGIU|nr:methionine adenosyltransferase [Mageeibacillus indolicus]ADC91639.1 methionine adenosyltransferase [Mageeibacillus indolicus UPII9-5]KFA57547.1 S-adenosylmethionine synthetase [Mageeibacillus indolicus 0009-5]PNH19552.1 methionine adenosyltransferase [Mageeibacillus indolicus]
MKEYLNERSKYLFSSESVTEGHPDKICDQISDAVLDAILAKDSMARVACETMTTTGMVVVAGEISTNCYVDIPKIVRNTVRRIGYTRGKYGFDADNCAVLTAIDEQSGDIAMGVNLAAEHKDGSDEAVINGAGDQGMMFGYACSETKEYMPLTLVLAHHLCQKLTEVRRNGVLPLIRPDGKAQVTVEYDGNKPIHIDTVVISTQHDEDYKLSDLRRDILAEVITPVMQTELFDAKTKIWINPTGRFVIGGPHGDTGVTGRKIIVDTYGGAAAHGGGAFSGKDPTKVDRSASYMARYAAKNVVAAGLAEQCQIQVAYAIGVAHPVSINVETFGTGKVDSEVIIDAIRTVFDFTPDGIIRTLDLRRPIYEQTAAYGHFGRDDLDLPWERLDKVDDLQKFVNRK